MGRVAIVSNAKFTESMADFVDDSYVVIRFSIAEGHHGLTGKKITHWVTRSWGFHTSHIQPLHKPQLTRAVAECRHVFVTYNFEEHGREGYFVPYSQRAVSNLIMNPKLLEYTAINAKATSLLHPNNKPTNGFMLLHHILIHDLWEHDEIVLVGFKGKTDAHHCPDWEQSHIDAWVRRGFFTKYH